MAITEQQIRSIVEQVVSKMIPEHKAVTDKSVTEKSIEPLNLNHSIRLEPILKWIN